MKKPILKLKSLEDLGTGQVLAGRMRREEPQPRTARARVVTLDPTGGQITPQSQMALDKAHDPRTCPFCLGQV